MSRTQRGLRAAIATALVAVAAYLCARTFWLFLHGPAPPPADLHRPTPPPGPTAGSATTDARQWHLFGTNDKLAPPAAGTNAPETTLDLTLVGVIQQGAPRKGWAIIRGGDDTTRLLRVGDAVADGITLSAIAPRHVLLDHDGRPEKLTLDQRTALEGVAAGPKPTAASDDARARLIEGLGVAPIRPGMAAGYRVENPEGGLARKYGFLEGDEILSVNGYPLGTAEDDRLAYHVASRADVAQLRVRRGDREIRLEYHADQDRIEGLDAQVKKFQDDQDVWRIGFKVTDASVSGGLLCSLADLSGMPWYLADSSTHDNFGNDDGVVWPGPIQGNIGTLEVLLAGSSVASNIHAHGVSYDNVDTFSLTGDLYNNGTDTAQGCSLSGDLTLDSPVNYLTVF